LSYGTDTNLDKVLRLKDNSTANSYVNIFRGPQSSAILSTTTAATFAIEWDYATVLVNTSVNPVTVSLPVTSASYSGRKFTIKLATGSNAVTINGNGATIDGSATATISTLNYARELQTDGTNWYIIGGFSG
jgi:uncharacterized Zn-binding protein involved in type VI secretion